MNNSHWPTWPNKNIKIVHMCVLPDHGHTDATVKQFAITSQYISSGSAEEWRQYQQKEGI